MRSRIRRFIPVAFGGNHAHGPREAARELVVSYCSGGGAGNSASGKFSGGGTKRGSLEFRLNCSPAGEVEGETDGVVSGSTFAGANDAMRFEEAGRMSSLET